MNLNNSAFPPFGVINSHIFSFCSQLSMQSSSGTLTCEPEEPFYYYKPESSSKNDVTIEVDPTAFSEDVSQHSSVVKHSIVTKRSVNAEVLREEAEYPASSPNFSPPPSNRTLYLNCFNQNVDCFRVKCFAGPFTANKSRAIINFKLIPIIETLGECNLSKIIKVCSVVMCV